MVPLAILYQAVFLSIMDIIGLLGHSFTFRLYQDSMSISSFGFWLVPNPPTGTNPIEFNGIFFFGQGSEYGVVNLNRHLALPWKTLGCAHS